jgi:hypothetical protein
MVSKDFDFFSNFFFLGGGEALADHGTKGSVDLQQTETKRTRASGASQSRPQLRLVSGRTCITLRPC